MQLHEAILLGSTIIKPARTIGTPGESGCAMGMAVAATGDIGVWVRDRLNAFKNRWPWTDIKQVLLPCCESSSKVTVTEVIIHIFDNHIMSYNLGCKKWTLEQLADWVKSVDPTVTVTALPEEEEVTEGCKVKKVDVSNWNIKYNFVPSFV